MEKSDRTRRTYIITLSIMFTLFAAWIVPALIPHATAGTRSDEGFSIGERLTYSISFENQDNAAYAELYVVSKGKLSGRDAVELSARIRTLDLLSAAFLLWDELRTSFVAPDTGVPMYVKTTTNRGVLPQESINDYRESPTAGFDLLSLIYKVRRVGGVGHFRLFESGREYDFDLTATGGEYVETEAGGFATTISSVDSSFLTELGISELSVNFSDDARRIPVLFRFSNERGRFTGRLASIQMLEPKPKASPAAEPTPVPKVTPTPARTPRPYVENAPLGSDLPFRLGEVLDFRLTRSGKALGNVRFSAKERKLFRGSDRLHLVAVVNDLEPGVTVLRAGDTVGAWVDPETLAPANSYRRLGGKFAPFTRSVDFDQENGRALTGGKTLSVPVGTHSLLSLAFAVRAFNLRPSNDPRSPVNDTRVALLFDDTARIVTLKPSPPKKISHGGREVSAQLINVTTGVRDFDRLRLRFWLSVDSRRLPLRFEFGDFTAELLSSPNAPQSR